MEVLLNKDSSIMIFEYTAIPNFFLMQIFNITHWTSDELDALSNDLPRIDRITIRIVTKC